MQHEVGKIVEGKVTGITKFGAFVELEGGAVGMVHISEVSQTYVNDISEHLKDQQKVTVKILSVNDDGKISLSIKKAMPQTEQQPQRRDNNRPASNFNNNRSGMGTPQRNNYQGDGRDNNRDSGRDSRDGRSSGGGQNRSSGGNRGGSSSNYGRSSQQSGKPATFDDMLTKFLASSDEKNYDTKREKGTRRSTQKKDRFYD